MDNTSHKMLNPHIERNLLVSRIQSDAGTAAGMNLAKKMVQGFIPGFSCRAIATLMLEGGKPVVDVRQIITYDWVLYQSHREAEQFVDKGTKFVSKTPTLVNESTENVNERFEKSDSGVLIPLTEILESVGTKDVNTQIIMESFDLNKSDLVGFTKDHKNIIIKDNNNTIYCNIDPDSRRRVNEYFKSF